jgi:hypothetical protein
MQSIILMNNIVPLSQAFVSPMPPPPPPISSFVTALCIVISIFIFILAFSIVASLLIVLFIIIICEFFSWTLYERRDYDLEEGERIIHQPDQDIPHSFPHAALQLNIRLWDSLGRFIEAANRQQQAALEKLPPSVNYGSQEMASSNHIDCVICLEEFEYGQPCQVFPLCNHIFHSNCIRLWLKKRMTCPICRVCILDA